MRPRAFSVWAVTLALVLVATGATPVEAADDTDGPTLSGLTKTPETAQNITIGDRSVDLRLTLADPAGVEAFCVRIDTPAPFPLQPFAIECGDATNRESGTEFDGVYRVRIVFPAKSHTGTYPIAAAIAFDKLGNVSEFSNADFVAAGYARNIVIVGTADLTPPVISQVTLTPSTIDVSRGQVGVTIRAHVKEVGTNLLYACLDFGTPEAPEEYYSSLCLFEGDNEGPAQDGFYSFRYWFDYEDEVGTFPLLGLSFSDGALNEGFLTPEELAAAGTPTAFTIQNGGPLVPTAPTAVSASAIGGSVALVQWTPPVPNGGPGLTKYEVTANPGGMKSAVSGGTTSAYVTGLSPSTTYTFSVRAVNVDGSGPQSASSAPVSTTAVAAGTPDAPTNVVATAAGLQAQVNWTPANANGFPVQTYFVTATPGGHTVSAAGSGTSTVVSGLTYGVTYTFTVTARNEKGTGPQSAPSNSIRPTAPPGIPTDVVATAGDTDAHLTWTAPSDNGLPITAYKVTASSGTERTFDGNATSVTVDGLINGQTYNFRVQAINAAGTGSLSAVSNTVKPVGKPKAPTNVTATAGNGNAHITWQPASSGGTPITGYQITASPGNIVVDAVWYANDATVPGLTNGVSYTFVVVAKNAVGTGEPSAPSNAVTPGGVSPVPDAPTNPTAIRGDQAATVSWSAANGNGSPITGYEVVASPGGASKTVNGLTTTASVTGLTNGVSYTFTVRAQNASGFSQPSAATAAVTPAGVPTAPTNVGATGGDAHAVLTWTPSNANGSPVTGYVVTASPSGATKATDTNGVTFDGLTNGDVYTFTVRATNVLGNSAASAPSNAVTPAAKPGTPTAVNATAGDTTAQVTWTAGPSNGAAISGYTLTASPDGATVAVAGSQTSGSFSGLTNGVAYTFTVRATNAVGDSAESSPSNVVTPAATVVETGLPLVAMAAPGASVALTRTIPVKWVGADISGIDHFEVRRRATAWNGSPGAWTSWKPSTTSTSTTDTGNYGRTYCYSVRAEDGVGNLSNWSSQRCTVVPLNSDQLSYSSGWKRATNAAAFAGFNRYTKTKGAKMTRTGIVAKGLSLVTTKCPTCGRVEVRWNGQFLKTFNLASTRTAKKQVLSVANWSTARKGTLTVTNVSASGKQVNIEGVAVYNG